MRRCKPFSTQNVATVGVQHSSTGQPPMVPSVYSHRGLRSHRRSERHGDYVANTRHKYERLAQPTACRKGTRYVQPDVARLPFVPLAPSCAPITGSSSFGANYRSLLASRSHSSNMRISPSRIGPLTLRTIERVGSSRNSTRTCETWPVWPVRPRTLVTFASLTG